jgi:hypothetical protein
MKTHFVTTAGAGFGAGVIPPGPLQRETPPPKRELRDEYQHALHDLIFSGTATEQEKELAKDLLWQRNELAKQATQLLDSFRVRARAQVRSEHEAAKSAVRSQQEKIQKHHEEIAALTRELNRAAEIKSLADAAWNAASEDRRALSRYASKREHEKADELLAKRESACDAAAKEHATILQRINFLTLSGLKPLMEKLNELQGEEARLDHFVTGRSYTTELGLVVPPSEPI